MGVMRVEEACVWDVEKVPFEFPQETIPRVAPLTSLSPATVAIQIRSKDGGLRGPSQIIDYLTDGLNARSSR
jgi:hypothetical protein